MTLDHLQSDQSLLFAQFLFQKPITHTQASIASLPTCAALSKQRINQQNI